MMRYMIENKSTSLYSDYNIRLYIKQNYEVDTMDEEQGQIVEEQVVEEDANMMEDDVVGRILNNAMPKGIDAEAKINKILGIEQ